MTHRRFTPSDFRGFEDDPLLGLLDDGFDPDFDPADELDLRSPLDR